MRSLAIILVLLIFLSACNLAEGEQASQIQQGQTPSSSPSPVPEATTTEAPSNTAQPAPSRSPATEQPTALPPTPAEAAPETTPLAGQVARVATALDLMSVIPPLRDDIRLAIGYLGADPAVATREPVPALQVGATDSFYIGNVDSNTISEIEAELMSVGQYAYYWFDLGDGSVEPDPDELARVTEAFDEIFSTLYAYFGVAELVDGRVHIVNASPNALCNDADRCRLAGYFSSRDLLPESIRPRSNERQMFVMNSRQFDSGNYLDVLAHELRHMLGNDYEAGEEDWFVEGGAMLAEDLAGFSDIPQARGSLFLENPDQQLNSWTDGNTIPYYGQGYLVNRFLYDRLGKELYQQFIFNEEPGLAAVDAVAGANQLDLTGHQLWLDWLAAMALRDAADVPEEYRWEGPELGEIATTLVNNLPVSIETTVNQYAADYYELPSSGEVTIQFTGTPTVSLMGNEAMSGDHVWYAQRANDSNPRLTRAVDLREVSTAALEYQVYADIETGYDFAYVSASVDGGRTWQSLEADGMQGLAPEDDPSNSALTARFYTGRVGEWVRESIDLTPFAGQEILLRFEYVTDPILTFGGFALDDIAITEIGFLDDAESLDGGWLAEGFTRATTEVPQNWCLQLIRFDNDGRPSVERVAVPENGQWEHVYQAVAGERRPLLIVAASAPDTLEPGLYSLDIRQQ
jgi:hypothetical protein